MPKPPKGSRLGAGPAHEKLMLAGLAAALFREERIRTTETKARRLRPVAEKLITSAKVGTIAARRRALAVVTDKDVVHKLFSDIGPRFADRNGGYTRIIKLGPRKGDAAQMVLIEIVEGAAVEVKPAEEERRRRLLRRRGRTARSAPAEEESSAPTPARAVVAEEPDDTDAAAPEDDDEEPDSTLEK